MLLSQIDEPSEPLRASLNDEDLHELARSMTLHGQLQAIGLKPLPKARYEIVFGHRRFLAAQINDWNAIGYELVTPNPKTSEKARQLVENTQRANLSPLEEARALTEMPGMPGLSQADLARQTSKSQSWVKDRLALLNLPADTTALLHDGKIPLGIALALGQIPDPAVREQYLNAAVNGGCTIETAKQWLYTYQLAAHGIAQATQNIDETMEEIRRTQAVDQVYNCFACGERRSYRHVNILVLCGACQDAISQARESAIADQLAAPLDKPS